MHAITDFMANDHRVCDAMLVKVEHAVTKHNWELARSEFADYRDGMLHHFAAEESVLFPLFEQTTGMYRGPTQVMRGEHAQMRLLLTADHGMNDKHLANGEPDVIYLQDLFDQWLGKDKARVILLCGGTKGSQASDIRRAKKLAREIP